MNVQKLLMRADCMDTLYNSGIRGKLCRLIYEMNKDTRIRIRAAFGTTSEENTGEGVGQGTIDGPIISACSIDYTVNSFFNKSSHEISYVDINLQPLLFQDDISGCALVHSVLRWEMNTLMQ